MHDNRAGKKLSTLRESLGLSVEQLAERSGCDYAVIEQLEAGRLAPSLTPLIKITRALGCRLGTLLDDDTESVAALQAWVDDRWAGFCARHTLTTEAE